MENKYNTCPVVDYEMDEKNNQDVKGHKLILDDEALTDFIDEETDNYWTVMHRDINEYLEALRNIIY